jgi:hypothetical protein
MPDAFYFAFSFAIVGMGAVGAAWDVFRRAIDADVERVRLKVEGMQRADYESLRTLVLQVQNQANGVERAVAFGRGR